MPAPSLSDQLTELAGGQDAVWTAVLEAYGPSMLGTCRRICASEAAAEDALQETFVQLLSGAARFRPLPRATAVQQDCSAVAWLHQVAANVACKHVRGEMRRQGRERRAAASSRQADEAGTTATDDVEWVRHALAALSDQQREPIVLAYFTELDHVEMARAMGCKPTASRARLSRSLKRLRKELTRLGTPIALLALPGLLQDLAAATIPLPQQVTIAQSCYRRAQTFVDRNSTASPHLSQSSQASSPPLPLQGVPMSYPLAIAAAALVSMTCVGFALAEHPTSMDQHLTPADPPVAVQADEVVDVVMQVTMRGQDGKALTQTVRYRFRGAKLEAFAEALVPLTGGTLQENDPAWAGQYIIVCEGPASIELIKKKLGRRWTIADGDRRHEWNVNRK